MIVLKSKDEIERMAEACRIVAAVVKGLQELVSPGVSTKELDRFAESLITARGGRPAFKGYRGYPASLCISLNEEVVHGIPSERKLREGDIASIDIGVHHKGFFGDAATTLPVGRVSSEAGRLIAATQKALDIGLANAVEGKRVSDISWAVQKWVESQGFSVVRNFVGHGIGRDLHEEPQIPNFGRPGEGAELVEGMTLAVEPMVNAGGWEVDILGDGWTAVTRDRSLSAHFEHTVAITKNGCRILTKL